MEASQQDPRSLARIVELVRDLRKRCPWDAAQTPESLRPYLVEEVMELDQAISEGDSDEIRTELGDMLLHLAFQIVLAEESGRFGAEDVTETILHKMIRRHPHLFSDAPAPESWELQKRREMRSGASILDGLPRLLPTLLKSYRIQERVAGVGFDWPDVAGPRAKVDEELHEFDEAHEEHSTERMQDEIGDLLFSVINLARKAGIDPRAALEGTNRKFESRFRKLEVLARERGIDLQECDLTRLDSLWNEAKQPDSQG